MYGGGYHLSPAEVAALLVAIVAMVVVGLVVVGLLVVSGVGVVVSA